MELDVIEQFLSQKFDSRWKNWSAHVHYIHIKTSIYKVPGRMQLGIEISTFMNENTVLSIEII